MKVLHVTPYYAPAFVYGGPPRSVHALCRALRRHGVEVQVFTTDANGAAALPAAVTVHESFEDVPVRYFARSFPRSAFGSRALAQALRREIDGYDVVHVHGLWNGAVWAAARAASRAGVPYVLSPRGMLQPAARAHRAWRKRAGWALFDARVVHGASLLHATSETERDTLRAVSRSAAVAFIPNGVAVDPPQRKEPRQPLVVFIGRVHPIKRIDLLIDAFAIVRERHAGAQLAIAGPPDGASIPALAARAGRHAEAVTWLGAVDDSQRRSLLAQASTLVMCSDSESFGMSVLEALASAVPAVVTRTCPWAELERHRAGYWVEQSAGAIAGAIGAILDDPATARAMGDRGRALAESTYDWTAIASAFVARYDGLRAQKGSGLGPLGSGPSGPSGQALPSPEP